MELSYMNWHSICESLIGFQIQTEKRESCIFRKILASLMVFIHIYQNFIFPCRKTDSCYLF